MRNLPPDLTDATLARQLQPFMERLSITDYIAEKQRKKPLGQVTFLDKVDGAMFLQHHGEEPLNHAGSPYQRSNDHRHPRTQARLVLMGKQVYCKLSNQQPREMHLKSIAHQATELQNHIHHDTPAEQARTLRAPELSCGHHALADERLIFTAEWTAREPCLVKFAKRNILIDLTQSAVQLRISFQSIVELVWSEDGAVSLTLSWGPTILASPPGQRDRRQRVAAIDSGHGAVSESCLVYHFQVPIPLAGASNTDFHSEISRIRHKNLFHVTRHNVGFQHAYALGSPLYSEAAAGLKWELASYNRTNSLPFSLLFLLQALLMNGYLQPATISGLAEKLARLFERAKKAGDDEPPISVDAFKKLLEWIDYPTPGGDSAMFEVDGIMEYLTQAERETRGAQAVKSKLLAETQTRARIFRALVTPTRVMLHGPEMEPMNRVLRKFTDHHSFFIRAQFCDEDGQDLFFNPRFSLDAIYDRFKSVLRGIQVAGRVYKLLGFSHSSLRAHSAWLSAPFVHREGNQIQPMFAELIISGLGDFGTIKSPARRAARIGQAFSETPYAVDLDVNKIEVLKIPDVERNAHVFSDGVGTISPGAAEAVYRVIPESKGFPTCFQIRWAGAKGMLSLDPRLQGNKLCIRPSMSKFESEDTTQLEICDMASKPIPMVLNRQLIKILEDMGAPPAWFLELEARELRRLRGITTSVHTTANFLRAERVCEGMQLHRFLRQTDMMGIDYRRDPFLRGAIEAVLLRELRLLKHKARIPVQKGMALFGVMDETGYLKEGEVYVAFDPVAARPCEPPGARRVIVTRSPALHPGDVQTAWNTVPPDQHPLLELRNCIAFSMWGDRPLASQLSGGDLDGDVFQVIWDPAVVESVRTFEAADYSRIAPLELDREVELADMAAFFVDFMKTDHLGVIATRHMILADQSGDGTLDVECKKLAELHSRAVDFSKTGRAVELIELPKGTGSWRPNLYVSLKGCRPPTSITANRSLQSFAPGPSITIHDKSAIAMDQHVVHQGGEDDEDNEEGPRYKYYKSEKILGQLYRAVDEQKIWAENIKMVIEADGPSFWDQLIAGLDQRVRSIGAVEWEHRAGEAQGICDM